MQATNHTAAATEYFWYVAGAHPNEEQTFNWPSPRIFCCYLLTVFVIFCLVTIGTIHFGRATVGFWSWNMLNLVIWGTAMRLSHGDKRDADAAEGLIYGLAPLHVQQFRSGQLWADVGNRLFFGLSLGMGVLQSVASFTNAKEPILVWSVCLGVLDTLITIGSSVFGYALLGVSAWMLNLTIKEAVDNKDIASVSARSSSACGIKVALSLITNCYFFP